MAEEEKIEEKEPSKREAFLNKMKGRMPDVNFDSENPEERYGAFDSYDEEREGKLGKYKENDEKLKGIFGKDPRFASFMGEVAGGGDTTTSFVKNFGRDALDASGDETKMEGIKKANEEYLARVADSKKLMDEQDANMKASAEAMSKFKKDKGMDDKSFGEFIDKCYGVVENALKGNLDESFLETMYKGMNYEKDLRDAADAGVVEGRNQKIDTELKKNVGDGIPSITSGGATGEPKAKRIPIKRDFYS